MNAKMTLTLDQQVIEQAKEFAKKQGRSLSTLVEHYLKTITLKQEDDIVSTTFSPIVNSIAKELPNVRLPKNYDYKEELAKLREEDYWNYQKND